nr:hypothetical protein [Kineosporia babensis]
MKVTLRDVEPRVLRVLDVPADSTLGELHDLLQIGVGWLSLEPYQFISGPVTYLPGAVEDVLTDLGRSFGYLYDPQSRWAHDVLVLGPGGDRVGCVYGEGVCPPDSTGGPREYAARLRELPESMREMFWAPHSPEFDQELTDLRVRQMAGVVPESVQQLLRLADDAPELGSGSHLPLEIVRSMHDLRPRWQHFTGMPPLSVLHGILRSCGLLVAGAGRVRDELFIVRKLRSWFAPGTFTASVAGLGVGALAARGALDEETLVGIVLSETDRAYPAGPQEIRNALMHLLPALTGLDLAERTGGAWQPGPSARTLLPQATALSVYASGPREGSGAPEQQMPV